MRKLALLLLVACGSKQHAGGGGDGDERFDCKERLISYVVSHHMGGSELGVQMDCSEGPKIKRWKVDKAGKRIDDVRVMSGEEFDRVWREIDGTGWPNLKDCANGTLGKQDPIYVFDVKDDTNKASFQCQSVSMPYPYNGLVDPLDTAAQQGRKELEGEPEELKDLDKKKPK